MYEEQYEGLSVPKNQKHVQLMEQQTFEIEVPAHRRCYLPHFLQ